MWNGPRIDIIYNLPLNLPVLVWREGNIGQVRHWDRPYKLLMAKGETYIVKLLSRPIPFWSIVVKPYLRPESIKSDPEIKLKP